MWLGKGWNGETNTEELVSAGREYEGIQGWLMGLAEQHDRQIFPSDWWFLKSLEALGASLKKSLLKNSSKHHHPTLVAELQNFTKSKQVHLDYSSFTEPSS